MAITTQQAQIAALYVSYFNRSPDPAGFAYWTDQVSSGMSLNSIANSFAALPEAIALYPFLANPTLDSASAVNAFLTSVYSNLFGRAIDPAGLAYWSGQVVSGKALGGAINNMISGAQGNDLLTVNNKATVGVEYAQHFTDTKAIWTSSDLSSSKSIISGVTFDSTTVLAAEATLNKLVAAPPPGNVSGKAIDGYIAFAHVFADANGNGVEDPGEASATTDKDGNFSLTGASGSVILSGGTDISTGLALKGVLKAPAGSTVVSPITSLIESLVSNGSSIADATAKIGVALGVDTTKVDLKTYDPLKVASDTTASAADRALALSVQVVNAKVANVLVAASSTLVGAVGDSTKLNVTDAGSAVIESIANNLVGKSGQTDLSDATFLTNVLKDSVAGADNAALDLASSKVDNVASTFADTVGAVSDSIDKSVAANGGDPTAALTKVAQAQTVAQGDLSTQLQTSTG